MDPSLFTDWVQTSTDPAPGTAGPSNWTDWVETVTTAPPSAEPSPWSAWVETTTDEDPSLKEWWIVSGTGTLVPAILVSASELA